MQDVPGGEGTLALGAKGNFTYDPGVFIGLTTFTYAAWDGQASSTATVTLTQGPNWRFGAASQTSADEDAGVTSNTINIVIELQQATGTPSTVKFFTQTGASGATAGSDYIAKATSTVTLGSGNGVDASGVASTTIAVTILNDSFVPVSPNPPKDGLGDSP